MIYFKKIIRKLYKCVEDKNKSKYKKLKVKKILLEIAFQKMLFEYLLSQISFS